MTKARGLTLDILSGITAFMMFVSLFTLPVDMLLNRPYIPVFFIAPFALCFWMRRSLKYLSLFILAHIALLCLAYFISADIYQRITYLALTLVIVIYSVVKRLKDTRADVSGGFTAAQAVCACALAIAAGRLNRPVTALVEPVTAGVTIICYIVFQHIKNLDDTLDLITRTTTQPVRSILSVNNRIIAAFAALAAVAALLSGFVRLDGAVMQLGRWLLWLLRFIVGLLSGKGGNSAPPAPDEAPVQQAIPQMPLAGDAKPWIFWVILEKIVLVAVIAAAVIGVVALIVYVCKRIYNRFYSAARTDDEVEVIPHDNMAVEAMKALRGFFIPLSGVRRHFYKKIRRHMGRGVPIVPSDTPEDMSKKITEEDISRLTEDYQRVRYK